MKTSELETSQDFGVFQRNSLSLGKLSETHKEIQEIGLLFSVFLNARTNVPEGSTSA